MGSKTKEAESLASFQAIMNFLSKEKKIIGLIGGGWFKSSLKMILPWMRQIVSTGVVVMRVFFLLTFGTRQTLEDVSNGFDKQRRRICADIVNIISTHHFQLHRRTPRLLTAFCRNGLLRDCQPCEGQKVACSSSVMLPCRRQPVNQTTHRSQGLDKAEGPTSARKR